MSRFTMTASDYFRMPKEDRDVLADWLSEVMGRPLVEARVSEVTLGEGFVSCLRYQMDSDGRPFIDGGEVATFTSTHPARTLPPVWLAGSVRKEPTESNRTRSEP